MKSKVLFSICILFLSMSTNSIILTREKHKKRTRERKLNTTEDKGLAVTNGFGGPLGAVPPLMINGVNMSAPMTVTVNEAPDPNIHATLHPAEIENFHLDIDNRELDAIEDRLGSLSKAVEDDNKDLRLQIEDKYSKSLMLN